MAVRLVQLLVDTGPGEISGTKFVVVRPGESERIPIQPAETTVLEIPHGMPDALALSSWLLTLLRPSVEGMSIELAAAPAPDLSADSEEEVPHQERSPEAKQDPLPTHYSAQSDKPAPRMPPTAAAEQQQTSVSYNQLLHDLRLAVQFYGLGHTSVTQAKAKLISHPNHDAVKMESCIAEALAIREAVEKLNRAAGDLSISDNEYRKREREFLKRFPFMKKKADKILSWRTGLKARVAVNAEARNAGRSLSSVKAGRYSHRIGDLSPHPKWTLYIDETGDQFESGSGGVREGRIVGVLFPSNKLPQIPLKPFHGTEATAEVADSMVQVVLDSECGVFGIGNAGLPQTIGERWVSGVMEVIQWVARLLPMDGPTALEVAIEQRGEYSHGVSWKLIEAPILRELVERDPVRYRNLRLQLQVFAKAQEPRLSYADAIAFSWGSGSAECRERIRASLLVGICLIDGDARQLRRAWDQFASSHGMEGSDWAKIVSGADARVANSITAALLERYGESVHNHPELWKRLLTHTLAHLDGKAVDLPRLRQEIGWLDRYKPDGTQLPKTVALAWAVGRLAAANHEGITAVEEDALVETLGKALHDERPDLACLGDLYQAVLATNRFDYDSASNALAKWQDVQIAVPGLQMWGRVQSSLGQIAAFQGELTRALEFFDRACQAFDRLSDLDARAAEVAQTSTYAAIAAMDDPSVDIADVKQRLSKVFELDVTTARSLAADSNPAKKYAHYLLLRYLVTRQDPLLEDAYLSERGNWSYSEGHPSQLIDAYRSHLISHSDPDRARALVRRAVEGCFDCTAGPTMVLIGLAIAVGSRKLCDIPLLSEARLDELQAAFPAAPRLMERLLNVPDDFDLPRTLAQVLPFNFR